MTSERNSEDIKEKEKDTEDKRKRNRENPRETQRTSLRNTENIKNTQRRHMRETHKLLNRDKKDIKKGSEFIRERHRRHKKIHIRHQRETCRKDTKRTSVRGTVDIIERHRGQ